MAAVVGAVVGVAFAFVTGAPIWMGVGAALGIAVGLVFDTSRRRP